jgi:hypothetical protein
MTICKAKVTIAFAKLPDPRDSYSLQTCFCRKNLAIIPFAALVLLNSQLLFNPPFFWQYPKPGVFSDDAGNSWMTASACFIPLQTIGIEVIFGSDNHGRPKGVYIV